MSFKPIRRWATLVAFGLLCLTIALIAGKQASVKSNPAFAPNVTATKAVAFASGGDVDGDGKADPGDTLQYTVTVNNTAAPGAGNDATGVTLLDSLSSITSLVAGSDNIVPLARNNTYNAIGNVQMVIPDGVGDVLDNDTDFDGGTLTVTGVGVDAASALAASNAGSPVAIAGATVTVQSNGAVTVNPARGSNTALNFFYAISDGKNKSTAQVTVNVAGMIWFVNTNAGACTSNCDGRFTNPYTTIAAFNSANAMAGGADPDNGDTIFVYSGTYTGPVALRNGQIVVGQGASATVLTITGIAPAASGTTQIPGTGGAAPTLNAGITLGQNNTLRGFVSGGAVTGNNFGTLTSAADFSINSTGQGLILTTGALGGIAIGGLSTAGGSNGAFFSSVTGNWNLGAGTLTGHTGSAFSVIGGTVSLTYNGNITQANNASAVSISGGHNTGVILFQTGTISATGGTGLQFDNADGTYNFNGTTTMNGGDAGIDILNGSSGTFSFTIGTSIQNPSGIAYNASASTPTVTYAGTITQNGNRAVSISNAAAAGCGTQTFSGNITGTGATAGGLLVNNCNSGTLTFSGGSKAIATSGGSNAAVTLTNNTGATINFSNGGLVIDTTNGIGFNATGGGTISVQGPGNTINATSGPANTNTNTALNVSSTTISASGLTFQSISSGNSTAAADPANGIVLNTAGASGGLTVTGNSAGQCGGAVSGYVLGTGATVTAPTTADCTGGTIQSTTGDGISLTSTQNVSLTRMNVTNNNGNGIHGTTVNGFSLISSSVTNNDADNFGTAESGLRFGDSTIAGTQLTGTCAITNSTVKGSKGDEVRIESPGGTLTNLVISGSVFGPNPVGTGGNGIVVLTTNNPSVTLNVTNSVFTGIQASGFLTTIAGTSTGTMNISGTTFTDNNINVDLGSSGTAVQTINVHDNTALRAISNSFNIVGDGAINGKIDNNRIGNGTADSGSRDAFGIGVSHRSNLVWTLAVRNNIVRNSDFEGMLIRSGDVTGNTGTLNLTLTGNTVAPPDDNSGFPAFPNGTHVRSRQNTTLCANIANNESQGKNGGVGYSLTRSNTSVYSMQGFNTNATTTVTNNGNKTNALTPTVITAGEPFNGACTPPVPAIPPPAAIEGGNADGLFGNQLSMIRVNNSIFGLDDIFDLKKHGSSNSTPSIPIFEEPVSDVSEIISETAPNYAVETSKTEISALEPLAFGFVIEETTTSNVEEEASIISKVFDSLSQMVIPTAYAQESGLVAGGGVVSKPPFTLPGGESAQLVFKVTVDNGPYAAGIDGMTNTAQITGTNFGLISASIPVVPNAGSIALDAAPDLSISSLSDGATQTMPGGIVTYTINYANGNAINGQGATGVTLTQVVPNNTIFQTAGSTAGWSCANNSPALTSCTLNVGSLNFNSNGSATFVVKVLDVLPASITTLSATALIADDGTNGAEFVGNTANNTGTDTNTQVLGVWIGNTSSDWNTASNWSNTTVPPTGFNIVNGTAGGVNSPQVISVDVTVGNLVLNGKNVTIADGRTINASGNVTLGANSVLGGAGRTGILSLGTTSAITSGGGFVNCFLSKMFAGAAPMFTYPVGLGVLSQVDVTNTAGTGALSIKASTGDVPTTPPGVLTTGQMLKRYWTLNETGALAANVVFHYVDADVPVTSTESLYSIFRVFGGAPSRYNQDGVNYIVNPAANTFTVNGLEIFSDWTAGNPLSPTAAHVRVSGRVLTAEGRPVFRAKVTIIGQNGTPFRAMTNNFGHYYIDGLEVGQTYMMMIDHKAYRFTVRTVSLLDEMNGFDIYAEP